MYAPENDSPSLWDMGTGRPFVEVRDPSADKPHLQLTCRSCGTSRWYLHRTVPISANPLPVFSIISPLWGNEGVSYERVRVPIPQPSPGEFRPPDRIPGPAQGDPNFKQIDNQNRQYAETSTYNNAPILDKTKSDIVGMNNRDSQNPISNTLEQPINCLSEMLDPFTYNVQEKPLMPTPLLNFENFETTPPLTETILAPPMPENVPSAAPSGENVASKVVKRATPYDYKDMNGHKHLKGNTTWVPINKRGRHSGVKGSHRPSTGVKKIEKKQTVHKADLVSPSGPRK